MNSTVESGVDDVGVRFTLRISDEDLNRYRREGDARLSVRWKCGATLASEELEPRITARHMDGESYEAWIDQRKIRGLVRVEIKVIAARDIPDYSLASQHPDYGDAKFEVRRGDVLADAGTFNFDATKSYDPFDPPIGSCFSIQLDSSLSRGLRVGFLGDERVDVLVSEEAFSGLRDLTIHPQLQIALVILPALVETVAYIRGNERTGEEAMGDRIWYQVIRDRIIEVESHDDTDLDVAQKILDYPIDRALRTRLVTEADD